MRSEHQLSNWWKMEETLTLNTDENCKCHALGYFHCLRPICLPAALVRRQKIPFGSSYKNSSKTEKNYRLSSEIFRSAIMNDLTMTFTSRLKTGAKCANQQWNWIRVANYFGTPLADWGHGYLCFEPGTRIWFKGFWCLSAYCERKKKSRKFSLNSARVGALGWPLPVIFFF